MNPSRLTMSIRLFLTVVLAFSFYLSGLAQGVVSYVASNPSTATDWTDTFSAPTFDQSLGTLTQVKLTFSGQTSQTIQAENLESMSRGYTLQSTMALTLARGDGTRLFSPTPIVLSQSGTLAPFDGSIDFSGSSGVTLRNTIPISLSLTDCDLGAYLSGATLTFTSKAVDVAIMTSSGNVIEQAISAASAQLMVEYSYTPIPEPSLFTVWLALAGLLVTLIRRGTHATNSHRHTAGA